MQVLLTGRGKNFCAGIDLSMAAGLLAKWRKDGQCPARSADRSRVEILRMQDSLTACERCRWPVVAAIHGEACGPLRSLASPSSLISPTYMLSRLNGFVAITPSALLHQKHVRFSGRIGCAG